MDPLVLVIFGITSNLAQIKLIPVLYDLAEKGLLPNDLTIIGTARKEQTRAEFIFYIQSILLKENASHAHPIKDEVFQELTRKLNFICGNLDDPNYYQRLKKFLDQQRGLGKQNVLYYLATYPELYQNVFENLNALGLNKQDNGFVRLMIEKPIGTDLSSAKELNTLLTKYFTEDQIYRLDHYLGKETLQNILTFRFGNDIFEPLLNAQYVDHIQISSLENFGIGKRGGYYDKVGALKDVGQNHMLQLLAFATMDPPQEFSNKAITTERQKVLQSLQPDPHKIVFGQYEGYKNEENVDPNSQIDTFFALKTTVNNDKFKDVPIYIRAGKNLAQTVTEISFVFKTPQNRLFQHLDSGKTPNVLIYRISPNEGIVVKILTKKPGHTLELENEYMQFCYRADPHGHYIPDAYERLIVDAMRGDQTFFNDAAEVEAQWSFVDPLVAQGRQTHSYEKGSYGPKESDDLIEADGRHWLVPSMDFCRI